MRSGFKRFFLKKISSVFRIAKDSILINFKEEFKSNYCVQTTVNYCGGGNKKNRDFHSYTLFL